MGNHVISIKKSLLLFQHWFSWSTVTSWPLHNSATGHHALCAECESGTMKVPYVLLHLILTTTCWIDCQNWAIVTYLIWHEHSWWDYTLILCFLLPKPMFLNMVLVCLQALLEDVFPTPKIDPSYPLLLRKALLLNWLIRIRESCWNTEYVSWVLMS